MAYPALATFNGTNLPVQFSYKPYLPTKRVTVRRTYNSVVTQATQTDYTIHGDGLIAWSVEAACQDEYILFQNWYDTAVLTSYTFVGYWGDSYTVRFNSLDNPTVRSRLWNFGGSWQVIAVTSMPQA